MHLSLDRVDIVLAPRGTTQRIVQSDERSAAEMRERLALSTIAVLIRCLNPRRMYPDLELFYSCDEDPPDTLRMAVAAAGAHLWVGKDPAFLAVPMLATGAGSTFDQRTIDELANSSFAALDEDILSGSSGKDPMAVLERMENEMARRGFPEEGDAAAFWTKVLELGALAARAIHARNRGSWTYKADGPGSLPLFYVCSFQGEEATVNPLGKAVKFLRAKGGGDEPSALVRVLAAGSGH